MQYKFTLQICVNDNAPVCFKGSFQEAEWSFMTKYLEYSYDLLNTKYVKDGMPSSLTVNWKSDSDLSISAILPDWDDVIVFLHKLRPIGLETENTYFYNICNILSKEIDDSNIRLIIGDSRDLFNGKYAQRSFSFQVNNEILNSEKVLKNWLNAYEYHRDEDKQLFIEKICSAFPEDGLKAIFLGLLSDKAQAIMHIAALIRVVQGKQNGVKGKYVDRKSNGSVLLISIINPEFNS